ncbi:MAG: tRNA (adenosine(37)-N6)-threonylcarbamoyltransferase complex transferase subunit TsaD [Candidatus Omnitrophica bacterium]|nr:tRNA (adenosine(37)-N6)-threonylcarbamoyltransferase complex transferase subunit TsaD [Candidatus Omnitrophota bacterium]MBU4303387.1 tRNA (adenosine(37)-N6)-threonylcarbamoyltransferase complex transferase subunit TsaD [Candidatus Omnitrophota bacterium]MBU4418278.1 tRNA (adenosine(37)-N6)-threonylcarbamoyltransferase complex transferase subunit TsaD [Candidatus Omnitrophota bacterium]MBU4468773.1 tRNA (adenosine(37)-N6)-threonylcarbamoyltransferase complex transferase subunit TsaD [Candidat
MIVLGIESSCDETGVAVVKNERKILANVIASSLKLHSRHGGVVPEIASRMQLESIAGIFTEAMQIAKIKPAQIDLVAVTTHPGLPGSLITGIAFAKALALSLGKPILGVNHIHSHIYANLLYPEKIKLPAVALVVSGGHTSLFYLKDFSKIQVLGQTRDDACGEAFDKVAKIMGLGYPGGPLIEKIARGGNEHKIKFACWGNTELDFSFSGIKTAVLYYLKDKKPGSKLLKDLAASFQESAVNVLVKKSLLACKRKKVKHLLIGGGVAANGVLRQKLMASAKAAGINCFFPNIDLCMDNAAMVAGLGGYLYKRGARNDFKN